MPRNKDRLQLLLYARPKHPGTYHYALFVSPKIQSSKNRRQNNINSKSTSNGSPSSKSPLAHASGTKFHVKNTLTTVPVSTTGTNGQQTTTTTTAQPWRFEQIDVPDVAVEQRLLARLVIGKVAATERSAEAVGRVLSGVPVYQGEEAAARGFNCVTWVKDGVAALRRGEHESKDDGDGVGKGQRKYEGKRQSRDKEAVVLVEKLLPWEEIWDGAMAYMERKNAEGRWTVGWNGGHGNGRDEAGGVPVMDLVEGRELIP